MASGRDQQIERLRSQLAKAQQGNADLQRQIDQIRSLGAHILDIAERDILSEGGSPFEVYKRRLEQVINIAYRIKVAP